MAVRTDILPPRYQSPTPIGGGGMATVYGALDTTLERHVAVKVLDDRHAGQPELRARFTREALTAARLSGEPHVITIFDVGEWRGRPYIVMEYLDGGSLADRLRAGRVTEAQALDWLAQAASALDAAHAAGVVHRDVKPGNLLIDGEGTLRVADFGIASAAGTASLTMTGTVMGTAGYLAPEQARGEKATAASDRYALAVVAHELLTGARPSRALGPVFDRALADDPAARYGSASEFVVDLRHALVGTEQTLPIEPGPRPAARRAGRRRVWPLVLFGLTAAAAGGAALAAVLVGGGGHSAGTTAPPPRVSVRTVTGPGTTVRQTVTREAPTTTRAAATTSAPSGNGHTLNDQGYSRLQAGDAAGALPLLQQAVRQLAGSGPGDPYEAYANYNLGIALLDLGRCPESIPYLDRARRLEPDRHEPRDALKRAKKC